MRTLPTIALALALSTSATLAGAQGQFYTGNRLHELAQKAQDPGLKGDLDWGVLTGYIVGVYDQSRQEGTHCKPQQVTVGQMRDVVINYLAAALLNAIKTRRRSSASCAQKSVALPEAASNTHTDA